MGPRICVIGALTLLLGACSSDAPSKETPVNKTVTFSAELLAQIDAAVQDSVRTGTIKRVDVAAHEVQVNPLVWLVWDADAKRAFTKTLAIYCEIHDGKKHELFFGVDTARIVTVIDSQSGEKRAHYSPTGFEVF